MNRIITIALSLLLLNGATELHQLWKLPLLVKHYQQHQQQEPSMSFLDFLEIHYSSRQHPSDNDENDDNRLPFNSTTTITHTDIPVIIKREIPTLVLVSISTQNNTTDAEGIPCDRSFSVFHPPRCC